MIDLIKVIAGSVGDICAASDRRELEAALGGAISAIGFDSFNLSCHKASRFDFMTDPTMTTWTTDDLRVYERDRWAARDPLLRHAVSARAPLHWTIPMRGVIDDPKYVEYLSAIGISNGVTAPLKGKDGTVSAFTLLSLTPRRSDKRLAQAAEIIGSTAMLRAETLGIVAAQKNHAVALIGDLSGIQLEILRWIAKGKTNRDIATIIGKSERAVHYHVLEILRKLSVGSRAQAAVLYASL